MHTDHRDIHNFFSIINEEISESPCSYTIQMGSIAKIVLTRNNQIPVRIGHPSGLHPPNDFIRKAAGRDARQVSSLNLLATKSDNTFGLHPQNEFISTAAGRDASQVLL